MEDIAKLKEETKKLIRSILVTTPDKLGVRCEDFLKDYREFNGTPLPFRKLGYDRPEDCLIDLKDVVRASYEGGHLILRCVATADMKHIQNLVNKQKISESQKKKRFRPSRPPPRAYSGYVSNKQAYVPPRLRSNGPSFHYNNSTFRQPLPYSQQENEIKAHINPTIKPFLRGQIRELCFQFPNGLHVHNFETEYAKRYGQRLNVKQLGFNDVSEMVSQMNDCIELKLECSGYKLHARKGQQQLGRLTDDPKPQKPSSLTGESRSARASNWRLSPDKDRGNADNIAETGPCSVNLKRQIRNVLAKYPSGVWNSDFQDIYKKETGHLVPLRNLGFDILIEFLGELPDIVRIERPNTKDWLLFDARISEKQTPAGVKREVGGRAAGRGRGRGSARPDLREERADKSYNTAPSIPDNVKEAIRQVMWKQPDGLLVQELPGVYKSLTGQTLAAEQLGFASVDALILQLSDVVELRYVGSRTTRLFVIDDGRPAKDDLLLAAPKTQAPSQPTVPEDAIGPGTHYLSLSLPANLDSYISVFVSNVASIDTFWIQLIGVDTTVALEALMDRLEDSYCSFTADAYRLPPSMVTVGQVCVAVFPEDNNWHRCTITAIRDERFVDVYYVDYGSTACVARSGLMFLKSSYLALPAQAMPARLANLTTTPAGSGVEGMKKMLELVMGKALYAIVVGTAQDGRLSVCLCDTSAGDDVWINDALVAEGYALFEETDSATSTAEEEETSGGDAGNQFEYAAAEAAYADADESETVEEEEVAEDQQPEGEEAKEEEENEDEEEEVIARRYIRYTPLTEDHSAHIISLDRRAWLVSAEISALFWEKDLLRGQLRSKKIILEKCVLEQETHPQLFDEFKHYDVRGCFEENGDLKPFVTVYELPGVLTVIDAFGHPSDELKEAVKKQIDEFNPDDPFWRGEDDDVENDDESEAASSGGSGETTEVNVDVLEAAMEGLQMQRKRIFRDMQFEKFETSRFDGLVDQLDMIERRLVHVRKRLNDAREHNVPSATDGAAEKPKSQLTEEDHYALQCVEEQYADLQLTPERAPSVSGPKKRQTQTVAPMIQPADPPQVVTMATSPGGGGDTRYLLPAAVAAGDAAVSSAPAAAASTTSVLLSKEQHEMLQRYQQRFAALEKNNMAATAGDRQDSQPAVMTSSVATMSPPAAGQCEGEAVVTEAACGGQLEVVTGGGQAVTPYEVVTAACAQAVTVTVSVDTEPQIFVAAAPTEGSVSGQQQAVSEPQAATSHTGQQHLYGSQQQQQQQQQQQFGVKNHGMVGVSSHHQPVYSSGHSIVSGQYNNGQSVVLSAGGQYAYSQPGGRAVVGTQYHQYMAQQHGATQPYMQFTTPPPGHHQMAPPASQTTFYMQMAPQAQMHPPQQQQVLMQQQQQQQQQAVSWPAPGPARGYSLSRAPPAPPPGVYQQPQPAAAYSQQAQQGFAASHLMPGASSCYMQPPPPEFRSLGRGGGGFHY